MGGEQSSTFTTEFEAWEIVEATLRTAVLERRTTLATELHALRIVLPAAQALHEISSLLIH